MIKRISKKKTTHTHKPISHTHTRLLLGLRQTRNGIARQLPNKKQSQFEAMKIKDFAESKMNIAFLLLGAFSPVLREDHITIRWQKENEVTQIRTEFAMCNKMQ